QPCAVPTDRSPRSHLVFPAGGFPVAQACPDRAAPTGSRWSALPEERPGPGRRGLMASGASPASRQQGFPEGRGPGRVALAAGGRNRVLGPETLAAGGTHEPSRTAAGDSTTYSDRVDASRRRERGRRQVSLSGRTCPDCGRVVHDEFQKTITGRGVCPD